MQPNTPPPKILEIAEADDCIRAVMLNGSRANSNKIIDLLSDWDIVYYVKDNAPYWNNPKWANQFGKMMIMQMPDILDGIPKSRDASFAYLMQFLNGSRIDLTIKPIHTVNHNELDSLSIILLDKDNFFDNLPEPSEKDYLPNPPSIDEFNRCCNEFWWVMPYIAKGLFRGEMIYAQYHLNCIVRQELFKMLVWYFGIKTDYKANPGKCGKFMKKQIPSQIWGKFMGTYCRASYKDMWDTMRKIGPLFTEIATKVADHFGYNYPHLEAEKVSDYIHNISFTF